MNSENELKMTLKWSRTRSEKTVLPVSCSHANEVGHMASHGQISEHKLPE